MQGRRACHLAAIRVHFPLAVERTTEIGAGETARGQRTGNGRRRVKVAVHYKEVRK